VRQRTEPLYLGVDAGNSKTAAVLTDAGGTVLGYGRGGCGDIYGADTEPLAVAEVVAAVRGALQMASRSEERVEEKAIARAAFCLAGIDWPVDEEYWHDQLAFWLPGLRSYSLRNDGFALLRAGEPPGVGVAVSAGTGAAVVARGPAGREWSASMWIADPLGGGALGRQAHAAVIRAELGIAPQTALREVLLCRRGFGDVTTMLTATTSRGAARVAYAALARDVLEVAGAGDAVASGIVDQQGAALAGYAVAAARKVGLCGPGIPVVLGGSVLSSANPALRDATRNSLAQLLPDARVHLSPRSPVVGAVAEALAEGGVPLAPETLDRLTGHRFPEEFLLT